MSDSHILKVALFLCLFLIIPSAKAVELPFSTPELIATGFQGPTSMTLADIDSDGDLDVVATSTVDHKLFWWEQVSISGTPSWVEHAISTMNFLGASGVAVGDIDGDGDLDVLSAASSTTEVAWWENDGTPVNGGWTKHTLDAAYSDTRSLALVDMDNDGDLDALGAGFSVDKVSWWINDGTPATGSWTRFDVDSAFVEASFVVAVDIDLDGDQDVVATAKAGNKVSWWENDGTPAVGAWTEFSVSATFNAARGVDVADIDGDGDLDIAGVSSGLDDVSWWENNGVGGDPATATWVETTIDSFFDGARFVLVRDMDTDGDLDVLAGAYIAGTVRWWENDGTPGVAGWTQWDIDTAFVTAQALMVADIDLDGDLDVAGTSMDHQKIVWWQNQTIHRSALFPARATIDSGNFYSDPVATDMDGDGDLDLLVEPVGGFLKWHQNLAGDANSWSVHSFTPGLEGSDPEVGDIDGDGDLDIVVSNVFMAGKRNAVHWWQKPVDPVSGTWVEVIVNDPPVGTRPDTIRDKKLADMDGDGDLDILVGYSNITMGFNDNTGVISWWENPADPVNDTWIEHIVENATVTRPSSLALADIDGDGDTDVIASIKNGSNGLRWWENSASGSSWTEHVILGITVSNILIVDYSQDGRPDVIYGDSSASISVALNPVVGTSWQTVAIRNGVVGEPSPSLVAADFDLDGDVDLGVAISPASNDLFWMENPNTGAPFWIRHDIETATLLSSNGLTAADINHDGKIDLLGEGYSGTGLTWWSNEGGQFALETTNTASSSINEGESAPVFEVKASHRGRTDDSDIELMNFELLFDDGAGTPLNSIEANALFTSVAVYRDDPLAGTQGSFDAADDLVGEITVFNVVAGVLAVPFMNDDADVQLADNSSKDYFLVVNMTVDAAAQTPNSFSITHVTEASSKARDGVADILLDLEYASDVDTGSITAVFASIPDHLLLQSENYSTIAQEEACIDITANTSVIVDVGADVVFRAETSVILEPGFSVITGGVFSVDISLPAGCAP